MARSFKHVAAITLTATFAYAQLLVSTSTSEKCNDAQYFDSDMLSCVECPNTADSSTVPTVDSKYSRQKYA